MSCNLLHDVAGVLSPEQTGKHCFLSMFCHVSQHGQTRKHCFSNKNVSELCPSVAQGFTLGSNILDFNIFYSCFDHLTVRILFWVTVYSAHNNGGCLM